MAFVVWDDRLSVGVEAIDEQHKKLLRIMNSLAEEMAARNGRQALERAIADLVDYTKGHFRYEEKLISNLVPQELTRHMQEHKALIAGVEDLQAKCKGGSTEAVSAEALQFLRDWLLRHIAVSDKAVVGQVASRTGHFAVEALD